ncbi:hypothetical protein [Streptacidiphilus jiangxiensis]|uniref:Uncharacterized protein n=1 Tax=Streptacidiphilus jiangxiensis TaxID=235985 RepID=A0A1H7GD76_STRJI|nr:hypothetical protein [Streptacidiphilus jiangxiensis]SEK35447.1 hypothetical protein SAMN05414137_101624 [Streptacidiphilus jiangxiensis]
MSDLQKKRLAQLGQQLQQDQLAVVRRQAEGWRNGLAGLTGLVSVVLVLKGKDSVTGMPEAWRWVCAALLAIAFGLLLFGALRSVQAANGEIGAGTWLNAEQLFGAVLDEVERTQRALATARRCTAAGLCLIVAGVFLGWVVPDTSAAGTGTAGAPSVLVTSAGGTVCGQLVLADAHGVVVREPAGKGRPAATEVTVPAGSVREVVPVASC